MTDSIGSTTNAFEMSPDRREAMKKNWMPLPLKSMKTSGLI